MTLENLLEKATRNEIVFKDVISFIENNYSYTPSAFKNGKQLNAENENQGSAKLLYFSKMNNLSKDETLKLFAEHYHSVLESPDGNDHQNIRQFMQNGWETVSFDTQVLK